MLSMLGTALHSRTWIRVRVRMRVRVRIRVRVRVIVRVRRAALQSLKNLDFVTASSTLGVEPPRGTTG